MTGRKRLSYRGDVTVVVLVILAVALLGAVGYIVWKNVSDNGADIGTVSSSSEKIEEPVESGKLVFTEWGAEVPLPESSAAYEVHDDDFFSESEPGDPRERYRVRVNINDCLAAAAQVSLMGKHDEVIPDGGYVHDASTGTVTWGDLMDEKYREELGQMSLVRVGDNIYSAVPPQQTFCENAPEPTPIPDRDTGDKIVEAAMVFVNDIIPNLREVK